MKNLWLTLSIGFALFSMFFGSGNLVFPVAVGQESQGHYLLAASGILFTGVIVPFLGVMGMMLYNGSLKEFFSSFGQRGTFWFSFLSLSLMGPFGVLARCFTVAHGALQLVFPSVTLPVASSLMCVVIYLLTINKNRIVEVLGAYLTPFLVLSISAIAYFGLKDADFGALVSYAGSWDAFKNGFFQGYQTMDLLAAFFFSNFIIKYLTQASDNSSEHPSILNLFFKSSLVGSGMLSLVYVVLVFLGWFYAPELAGVAPQEMLGKIAMEALGPFAAPCVCLAMVLACLTTAIVLTTLFADFLRQDISNHRLGTHSSLFVTLIIAFFVSTLDFAGIAQFLGPVLETIYPALIVLTIVNIAHKLWGVKSSHWPTTLTIFAKLCTMI